MTNRETAKALAMIQEIYPHFMDGRNPEATAAIWGRMFGGEAYERVEAAVLAFVSADTKGYPPNIGQIKEKIAQMGDGRAPDEAEAWALVYRAMCRGATAAEYGKLPPEIRSAVGDARQLLDWSLMDIETVNSVVMSNFQRAYRARAGHIREMRKLPADVRRLYTAEETAYPALPEAAETGRAAYRPDESTEAGRAAYRPDEPAAAGRPAYRPDEPAAAGRPAYRPDESAAAGRPARKPEAEPVEAPAWFHDRLTALREQAERERAEAAREQAHRMVERMIAGVTGRAAPAGGEASE